MEVLIVGAGPTGLMLAIELVRRNIPVRIFDKSNPRPKYESRAIGTHARTMEIFERLGVLGEMFDLGIRWSGFNLHANNKQIGRIRFDQIDSKFNFALVLPQAETERILRENLRNLGVAVETEVELINLAQNDDRVSATFKDKSGNAEKIESAFLIGCDGAKSATRKLLNLDFVGKRLQGSYLADCEAEWQQEPLTEGNTFLKNGWRLIVGQLPENRYRVVVNMPDTDARMRNETPTLSLMQKFVDEAGLKMRLQKLFWASAFYLSIRRVEKMRVGRVFLAGDAAHNVCPNAGQGMNAGIHDAAVLAAKLSLLLRNKANKNLLDDYERERLPVIKRLLTASERMENMMTLRNGVVANLRSLTLPLVSKSDFLQKKIVNNIAGINVKLE